MNSGNPGRPPQPRFFQNPQRHQFQPYQPQESVRKFGHQNEPRNTSRHPFRGNSENHNTNACNSLPRDSHQASHRNPNPSAPYHGTNPRPLFHQSSTLPRGQRNTEGFRGEEWNRGIDRGGGIEQWSRGTEVPRLKEGRNEEWSRGYDENVRPDSSSSTQSVRDMSNAVDTGGGGQGGILDGSQNYGSMQASRPMLQNYSMPALSSPNTIGNQNTLASVRMPNFQTMNNVVANSGVVYMGNQGPVVSMQQGIFANGPYLGAGPPGTITQAYPLAASTSEQQQARRENVVQPNLAYQMSQPNEQSLQLNENNQQQYMVQQQEQLLRPHLIQPQMMLLRPRIQLPGGLQQQFTVVNPGYMTMQPQQQMLQHQLVAQHSATQQQMSLQQQQNQIVVQQQQATQQQQQQQLLAGHELKQPSVAIQQIPSQQHICQQQQHMQPPQMQPPQISQQPITRAAALCSTYQGNNINTEQPSCSNIYIGTSMPLPVFRHPSSNQTNAEAIVYSAPANGNAVYRNAGPPLTNQIGPESVRMVSESAVGRQQMQQFQRSQARQPMFMQQVWLPNRPIVQMPQSVQMEQQSGQMQLQPAQTQQEQVVQAQQQVVSMQLQHGNQTQPPQQHQQIQLQTMQVIQVQHPQQSAQMQPQNVAQMQQDQRQPMLPPGAAKGYFPVIAIPVSGQGQGQQVVQMMQVTYLPQQQVGISGTDEVGSTRPPSQSLSELDSASGAGSRRSSVFDSLSSSLSEQQLQQCLQGQQLTKQLQPMMTQSLSQQQLSQLPHALAQIQLPQTQTVSQTLPLTGIQGFSLTHTQPQRMPVAQAQALQQRLHLAPIQTHALPLTQTHPAPYRLPLTQTNTETVPQGITQMQPQTQTAPQRMLLAQRPVLPVPQMQPVNPQTLQQIPIRLPRPQLIPHLPHHLPQANLQPQLIPRFQAQSQVNHLSQAQVENATAAQQQQAADKSQQKAIEARRSKIEIINPQTGRSIFDRSELPRKTTRSSGTEVSGRLEIQEEGYLVTANVVNDSASDNNIVSSINTIMIADTVSISDTTADASANDSDTASCFIDGVSIYPAALSNATTVSTATDDIAVAASYRLDDERNSSVQSETSGENGQQGVLGNDQLCVLENTGMVEYSGVKLIAATATEQPIITCINLMDPSNACLATEAADNRVDLSLVMSTNSVLSESIESQLKSDSEIEQDLSMKLDQKFEADIASNVLLIKALPTPIDNLFNLEREYGYVPLSLTTPSGSSIDWVENSRAATVASDCEKFDEMDKIYTDTVVSQLDTSNFSNSSASTVTVTELCTELSLEDAIDQTEAVDRESDSELSEDTSNISDKLFSESLDVKDGLISRLMQSVIDYRREESNDSGINVSEIGVKNILNESILSKDDSIVNTGEINACSKDDIIAENASDRRVKASFNSSVQTLAAAAEFMQNFKDDATLIDSKRIEGSNKKHDIEVDDTLVTDKAERSLELGDLYKARETSEPSDRLDDRYVPSVVESTTGDINITGGMEGCSENHNPNKLLNADNRSCSIDKKGDKVCADTAIQSNHASNITYQYSDKNICNANITELRQDCISSNDKVPDDLSTSFKEQDQNQNCESMSDGHSSPDKVMISSEQVTDSLGYKIMTGNQLMDRSSQLYSRERYRAKEAEELSRIDNVHVSGESSSDVQEKVTMNNAEKQMNADMSTGADKEKDSKNTPRRQYDRDFLLQLQFTKDSLRRPPGLNMPDIVVDAVCNTDTGRRPPMLGHMYGDIGMPDCTPGYIKSSPSTGRNKHGRSGILENIYLQQPPHLHMLHQQQILQMQRQHEQQQRFLMQQHMVRQQQQQRQQKPTPQKVAGHKVINVSLNQSVQLHTAENAYKIAKKSVEESSADLSKAEETETLYRKFRSILNKLTDQNQDKLMEQVKELNIDTAERLSGCIDIIFEKAVAEPSYSAVYASMANAMLKISVNGEDGQLITFRKLLLDRCQSEFEDNQEEQSIEKMRSEISQATNDEVQKQLTAALEQAIDKAKRRSLGNIRFIGELYKLHMLTEGIMHNCISRLLGSSDVESLVCLCRLLFTIGAVLDSTTATNQSKRAMNVYIEKIQELSVAPDIPSRIRFMLRDVFELKQNNWVSRKGSASAVTVTPGKTMEQIQNEAIAASQQQRYNLQHSTESQQKCSLQHRTAAIDASHKHSAGQVSTDNSEISGRHNLSRTNTEEMLSRGNTEERNEDGNREIRGSNSKRDSVDYSGRNDGRNVQYTRKSSLGKAERDKSGAITSVTFIATPRLKSQGSHGSIDSPGCEVDGRGLFEPEFGRGGQNRSDFLHGGMSRERNDKMHFKYGDDSEEHGAKNRSDTQYASYNSNMPHSRRSNSKYSAQSSFEINSTNRNNNNNYADQHQTYHQRNLPPRLLNKEKQRDDTADKMSGPVQILRRNSNGSTTSPASSVTPPSSVSPLSESSARGNMSLSNTFAESSGSSVDQCGEVYLGESYRGDTVVVSRNSSRGMYSDDSVNTVIESREDSFRGIYSLGSGNTVVNSHDSSGEIYSGSGSSDRESGVGMMHSMDESSLNTTCFTEMSRSGSYAEDMSTSRSTCGFTDFSRSGSYAEDLMSTSRSSVDSVFMVEAGSDVIQSPDSINSASSCLLGNYLDKKICQLVSDYIRSRDYKEAVRCVKNLGLNADGLSKFVANAVSIGMDNSSTGKRSLIGQLLAKFLNDNIFISRHVIAGLSRIFQGVIEDSIESDVSRVWNYLAEVLESFLLPDHQRNRKQHKHRQLQSVSKSLMCVCHACHSVHLNKSNSAGCAGLADLVAGLLLAIQSRLGDDQLLNVWRDVEFNWSDFLPLSDVSQMLRKKNLSHLLEASGKKNKINVSLDIEAELKNLLNQHNVLNEENILVIYNWIDTNIDRSQVTSASFLRALTNSICDICLQPSRRKRVGSETGGELEIGEERLRSMSPLMKRYIHCENDELEILFSLQLNMHRIRHPPNVLHEIFRVLYDQQIISEPSFRRWRSEDWAASSDIMLGRGVALQSVARFFTFLETAH